MNNETYSFFLICVYDLKNDIRRIEKDVKKKIKSNYKYS